MQDFLEYNQIDIVDFNNRQREIGKKDYFKIDKETGGLWLIVNEGVEEYRLFDKRNSGKPIKFSSIVNRFGGAKIGVDRVREYFDSTWTSSSSSARRLVKVVKRIEDCINDVEEAERSITPGIVGEPIVPRQLDYSQTGLPGTPGMDGKDGLPGTDGMDGDKGDQGDRGAEGKRGKQGKQGEVGAEGKRGKQGDKGDQGDIGDKGDQGDKGAEGRQGLRGDVGVQGIPGTIGVQGERGIRGEVGRPSIAYRNAIYSLTQRIEQLEQLMIDHEDQEDIEIVEELGTIIRQFQIADDDESMNRILNEEFRNITIAERERLLDEEEFGGLSPYERQRILNGDELDQDLLETARNRERLGKLAKIKAGLERLFNKHATLKRILERIFSREGLTIASIITAIGAIIASIVSIMTGGASAIAGGGAGGGGGVKNWITKHLKNFAKLLSKLGEKILIAIPGIIGGLISTLFKTTANIFAWLASNLWVFMVGGGVVLYDYFKT